MSVETIARRYGAALADVVLKTGETAVVRSELEDCVTIFAPGTDLYNVFSNPSIQHAQKEKLLESLIAKASPSKTTSNFLRVLLKNGRITEIGEIAERFNAELEQRSGVLTAEVISAREMPDGERSSLQANLEKLTGKKVNLNFNIDEAIIGGVITRVGSTVYDGSVKTQLENLKQELMGS